jgi:tetratricopeptide (TPR) repeat protein
MNNKNISSISLLRRVRILLILLATSINMKGIEAQLLYGENPEKCKQKLSIMTTYYKQKAYLNAAPSWRYVIKNCPQASKNTYIIGAKIMELFIKEATDEQQKSSYVDSLLLIQDMRMKYFPHNTPNKHLAKKAIYLLKYRLKKEYKTAFHLLDSAFKKEPKELSAYDMKMYLYCYKLMVKSKTKPCEEMLTTLLSVNQVIEQREQNGKTIKASTKEQITSYAENCMTCELLDSLYGRQFEKKKLDTSWLDNGISLFKRRKCNNSETFLQLLETRYLSKPNSTTASILGKYFVNTGKATKASAYFDDAIKLEQDPVKKATHHVTKANFLISSKKYKQAFNESKNAISSNTSNAAAYLTAGNALAYGANQCSNATFGGKEVYWLAVDYYQLVLKHSTKENEKKSAQNKINKFKKYFPAKGEVFLKSLNEGAPYQIVCFANEKTTVRSKK